MYEHYYGLSEPPFSLTANPKFLFLTPQHREALSSLQYGIASGAGVTALSGEAGTGKTTLIKSTLASTSVLKTFAVYLNNPAVTRDEFLQFLAREFQLGSSAAASKTVLLEKLGRVLTRLRNSGLAPALIIDEAQSLPHELLEEIRLLSNVETADRKMLSIVLAGQPELAERLNEQSLRQLKQRVEFRCLLQPLDLEATSAYIVFRVKVAGGDAFSMFTREAVKLIFQASKGIPRTISVICNNALMTGFAMQQRLIGPEIVGEVCSDFDFQDESRLMVVSAARNATGPAGRAPSSPAAEPQTQPAQAPAKDFLKVVAAQFRRFPFFQQS